MDRFERHIRENAAQFDGETPDRAKIWKAISQELEGERSRPWWGGPNLRLVAGMALLIGLSGLLAFTLMGRGNAPGAVSKELSEVDMYYKGLVDRQVQLVHSSPLLSEGDKREFLSFMEGLDREYGDLCREMDRNIDNELVLQAIVANYRKRIELIENLLQQIADKKKNYEDYGYTL